MVPSARRYRTRQCWPLVCSTQDMGTSDRGGTRRIGDARYVDQSPLRTAVRKPSHGRDRTGPLTAKLLRARCSWTTPIQITNNVSLDFRTGLIPACGVPAVAV